MICPACEKITDDLRDTRHRRCYRSEAFPRLRDRMEYDPVEEIMEYAAMGITQKDTAAILGISYRQFRRVVRRMGLRGLFLAHGGAATQAAIRGVVACTKDSQRF